MKKILLLSISSLLFIACHEQKKKKPTGFEYEATNKAYKRLYEHELYYTDGHTNVDSIRNAHMISFSQKVQRLQTEKETFANGKIEGQWFERGPVNEAGDLREVDYDAANNRLFVMSTAGHIFQGTLDGNTWNVLNDRLKFNTNILNHVVKNNVDRLIAVYGNGKENKIPRYSDDLGKTWTLSTGFDNEFYDHWGSPKKIIELDGGRILYYLVQTWKRTPWGSAMEVYKSTDWGESFTQVVSVSDRDNSFNNIDFWKPINAGIIYIVDNDKKQFYSLTTNLSNGSHTLSSPISINGLGNGNIKLSGRYENNSPTLYALIGKNAMYKSTNGSNWSFTSNVNIQGENEVNIFRNVFMANPLNKDIYMGGFQFYTTTDEKNWTQHYPYWWKYYEKSIPLPERQNYMHVDMMEMEFFRKSDNTPFLIILNHAGIYVSYDNMETTTNLGLNNLNVVTLYDHATASDGTIFFGAQDKGTFSNTSNNNTSVSLITSINETTGDGMRELFFNNGKSWFGFLQNGYMMCKYDKNEESEKSWQVPGNHIPGWINPVENHPDPNAKKCYVAGGNINGGDGSYLILMEVSWTGDGNNFQWNPTQFNYDFRANSRDRKSVIKALSASTNDLNRLYVATNDGTFFTSKNGGTSWIKSNYNIPTSLKPWDIIVSKNDADKVIMCGTGWDNTGVYLSTNGGENFEELDTDAPKATYFDMVFSEDEETLYAATSEGPYAYVFEDNRWYNIGGQAAPFVDYRSVEYISSNQTVRFGTYGRGVWDFVMEKVTTTTTENIDVIVQAYPNPFMDIIHISGINTGKATLYNKKGQKVLEKEIDNEINTSNLAKGIYFLTVESEGNTYKFKLIK